MARGGLITNLKEVNMKLNKAYTPPATTNMFKNKFSSWPIPPSSGESKFLNWSGGVNVPIPFMSIC